MASLSHPNSKAHISCVGAKRLHLNTPQKTAAAVSKCERGYKTLYQKVAVALWPVVVLQPQISPAARKDWLRPSRWHQREKHYKSVGCTTSKPSSQKTFYGVYAQDKQIVTEKNSLQLYVWLYFIHTGYPTFLSVFTHNRKTQFQMLPLLVW